MERYFEGEMPDPDTIRTTVHNGMLTGEIFPVLVGSATRRIGVDTLCEFLYRLCSEPARAPAAASAVRRRDSHPGRRAGPGAMSSRR